jgi:non-ribosomal peptide synthetase component F
MNSITLHGRAVEIIGNAETHLPDQNQSAVREPDTQGNRQFLVEWNQTSSEFPRNRCVHELFAEQTRQAPLLWRWLLVTSVSPMRNSMHDPIK